MHALPFGSQSPDEGSENYTCYNSMPFSSITFFNGLLKCMIGAILVPIKKVNKVPKFYLCFHFSTGEYRSYTVPSFAAISLPTPWMNKNLVKHKKFLENNYITTLCPF